MPAQRRKAEIARRIAVEAARQAVESERPDLAAVRRKAAEKLGCVDQRLWPDLATVAEAVREQQRLFRPQQQGAALTRLRELALNAMRDLAAFSPRLVGPVQDGTADTYSAIRLHLYADTPEEVIYFLTDRHIPWRDGEVTLRYSRGRQQKRPCLRFRAGNQDIELVVLSASDRGDPPVDPEREEPLRGATPDQVEGWLSA
jgi:hypothetical protein